jgi:hypothetical protein
MIEVLIAESPYELALALNAEGEAIRIIAIVPYGHRQCAYFQREQPKKRKVKHGGN